MELQARDDLIRVLIVTSICLKYILQWNELRNKIEGEEVSRSGGGFLCARRLFVFEKNWRFERYSSVLKNTRSKLQGFSLYWWLFGLYQLVRWKRIFVFRFSTDSASKFLQKMATSNLEIGRDSPPTRGFWLRSVQIDQSSSSSLTSLSFDGLI